MSLLFAGSPCSVQTVRKTSSFLSANRFPFRMLLTVTGIAREPSMAQIGYMSTMQVEWMVSRLCSWRYRGSAPNFKLLGVVENSPGWTMMIWDWRSWVALPNQRLKLTARGGRLKGRDVSCLRPPQAAA
jgi:hypothetical protein